MMIKGIKLNAQIYLLQTELLNIYKSVFNFRNEIASMDYRNIYDNRHNIHKLFTLRLKPCRYQLFFSTHSFMLQLFHLWLALLKCLCLLNNNTNISINGLCFSRKKCFSFRIISGGYCDCLNFNGWIMTSLYSDIISGPVTCLEFLIQHFLRNQS